MDLVVWLGSLVAVLGGCSLIYDVDDLPDPDAPVSYGAPTKITDGGEDEENPTLVGDGSYVYFTTFDGGDDEDVWRRDRVGGAWSKQREVIPLTASPEPDRVPRLTASGDRLYLIRPGAEGLGVFVADRGPTLHTWTDPVAAPTGLDETGDELAAAPCDGDRTVFVIHSQFPVSFIEEVRGATGFPVDTGALTDLRTVSSSPDCLRLLISAHGTGADLDLFVVRRHDRGAPWSAPVRLDALSTGSDERSPSSTGDGEMIVFERDGDLWESHAVR